MTTYILMQWTDQGIKNVKTTPKRLQDSRALAKSFGVEWKSIYATMGRYDFVITVEAPDDAAVSKYVLSLGSLGNVRSTSLKAFTEAEYIPIMEAVS